MFWCGKEPRKLTAPLPNFGKIFYKNILKIIIDFSFKILITEVRKQAEQ